MTSTLYLEHLCGLLPDFFELGCLCAIEIFYNEKYFPKNTVLKSTQYDFDLVFFSQKITAIFAFVF